MSKTQPILQSVPRKPVNPPRESMMVLAQFGRNNHLLRIDDEYTLDDFRHPHFWTSFSQRLAVDDVIEIVLTERLLRT